MGAVAPLRRQAVIGPAMRPVSEAVILAGGIGSRLHPYTLVIPKPLMPLDDLPILEILLRQLRHHGVRRAHIAIGHLGHFLRAHFGDGSRLGMDIRWSEEEVPLGTAGPVALIDDLPDHFFVLNGDVLTDLDFSALAATHLASGAAATVATYPKRTQLRLGVLALNDDGDVTDYIEKPTYEHTVSMGIYCMSRAVLPHLQPGVRRDLPELVLDLIGHGERVRSHRFEGRWLDMGTPEDYRRAFEDFKDLRDHFLPS